MYCVMCGVKLADTEEKCPLCGTQAICPVPRTPAKPLYPRDRYTQIRPKRGVISGVLLMLFLIPILICFLVDWQTDHRLGWFGYAAGGIALAYIVCALPVWFYKPNPVIFVPCDFAAVALYLLYIDLAVGGGWFLPFALPVIGCIGLPVTALVTLLRYLHRGRLYIFGGGLMVFGGAAVLTEYLLHTAFAVHFVGWSFYVLVAMFLLGAVLIYLGINSSARERMERKLFF